MDGYRLCYEIRRSKDLREIPFILYASTSASPSHEALATSVGADRYIRRPAPAEVLLSALQEAKRAARPRAEPGSPTLELEILQEYSEGLLLKLQRKSLDLAASEKRYRELVALAPIGIYSSSPEGRFVSVNTALVHLLGYDSAEEVLRLDLGKELFFEDTDRVRLTGDIKRQNGIGSFEIRLKRKDGEARWVRLDARAVRDESGRTTHFEGFVHEIDERRRAEKSLQESEQKYRSLFESMFHGYAHCEMILENGEPRDFVYLDVNTAFEKLTGLKDVVGRRVTEVIPGIRESSPELFEMYGRVALTGIPERFEIYVDALGIWFSISAYSPQKGHFVALFDNITEGKRAGEVLRQSEERFHRTFSASPVGMSLTEAKSGRFLDVNERLASLLGYCREELIGKTSLELDIWSDPMARTRLLEEVEASRPVREREIQVRTKSGEIRDLLDSVEPLRIGGERVLLSVFQDITHRKRAEQDVRKLLNAVEQVGSVIYMTDPDGVITYVNPAFEKTYGYSREDALGKTPRILKSGRHDRPFYEGFWKKLLAGESVREDFINKTRDGRLVTVETFVSPVLDAGGRRVGFIAVQEDVTERKRAEEGMRKSEERFRRLFDSNTIGIVIADLTGGTLEANDSYLNMLGYTREELVSGRMRWDQLTPPEHFERDQIAVEQLQRTGVASPWEKELIRKDGTRVPILIGVAMLGESEGSCIAYIVDLSSRRQLEGQFRQAQKMEAIGQLAGGIAHDFNNLLTAILGYADLLTGEVGEQSPLLDSIGEIRRAGERAASLTRQLLAFSRRQVLEPKVLDLNALLENLEKMLRRLIGEDVELVAKLDPGIGRVRADAGQIEQVVMNLAVNARDAMPRGGTLTLETKDVELDEAYAREHVGLRPGRHVMLAISDTGVGMSAETKSHVFEPFFTTKERGKGTGLGLATVYGIVKQSGGYVWVYTELNRGTTIKVYLPRVEGAVEAARRHVPSERATGGSETVLLVEDEQGVRTLVRRVLESYGYTVLEAGGAGQALQAIQVHEGPIHLILTDVVMPEMGGSELATRLAGVRPGARVLFMSGYTDDAIVRQGLIANTGHFLQKPFTPEVLALKVREILDNEP